MKKNEKIILNIADLHSGDIILVHTDFNTFKPSTWLPVFIRLFERDYYNHAAIVYVSCNGIRYISESLINGVVISVLRSELESKKIKIIRHNSLLLKDNRDLKNIKQRIVAMTGVKYDFAGCLLFQMLRQLGEVISPELQIWLGRKGTNAAKRFYCSEFVAWCLQLSEWWQCSPDDLDNSDEFKILYQGRVSYY